MRDVPSKSIGDQLTAEEYNQGTNEELKNTVQSSGQTLSPSDLFQLAKTVAIYVGSGDFYTDSGTANNYILSAISPKQAPTAYDNGLRMRFSPANTNTGASTVNLATIGVKNIKTAGGDDPGAGAITAGRITELVYDGTNAIIYNTSVSGSEFSTGDAKPTLKTVADAGWVIMDDGTIGSATSGATTRANADCEQLFKLLWNNIPDTWAPVVGGRGASADADWTANKEITLPRQLGRALSISGSGAGLTARALGEYLGEENHILTQAELPVAFPQISVAGITAAGLATSVGSGFGCIAFGNVTPVDGAINGNRVAALDNLGAIADLGSDTPHNTMQPSAFWNIMIKL
jgi:microcystin-dependent protein